MSEPKRAKRRILSAGAGMVAITAVEGLACGNPVAPRHDMPHEQEPHANEMPIEDGTAPAASASASASSSASADEAPPPEPEAP